MNLVEAEIGKKDDRVTMKLGKDELYLPADKGERVRDHIGKRVWFGIRPENIGTKVTNPEARENFVRGRISVVEQMGNEEYIHYILGKNQFISRIPVEKAEGTTHETDYDFWFDMSKCHIFDHETEDNISL